MSKNQHVYQASHQNNIVQKKIDTYFIPFSIQMEKFFLLSLVLLFLMIVLVQVFMLSNEDHQAMISKVVRYEGVFHEDNIESRATLQRN